MDGVGGGWVGVSEGLECIGASMTDGSALFGHAYVDQGRSVGVNLSSGCKTCAKSFNTEEPFI